MARVAIQFVANSNMGAVSKDIARINAQLATLAAEMQQVGIANNRGVNSLADSFRKDVANIRGFETATMSARTATAQLTEELNRQQIQMKDMVRVRRNLGQLAQEQLRLQDSSAMPLRRDLATGRVMGELIVPTNEYARSARLAAMEAGILGRALESAGLQAVNNGKRMQWTGRQLTAGLTAPIIAVGAVSAVAAYQIDDAMVRLVKVYGDLGGATEDELKRVEEATMETARVVASSYGIAGKATVELAADLAAAGYEGERLQETTREIQRISLLGELDQQKAMDATRTIQTVFGISTADLADKFNFLNAVENQTNTTLQDLTEVIPRTANVVRELGGSLEDSAIFTVAFKEAGIDAVQGANALRSSLGAIVAPSDVATAKLKELGIDIRGIAKEHHPDNGGGGIVAMLQALGSELDNLGGLARQEALAKLFGRYQFNKMDGLLKGLSDSANDTSTQVGRAFALTQASTEELAAVAEREVAAIQESLSGRLRRAAQTVVLTFAEIGRPILSLVVTIVEGFAAVLNVINKFPGVIKGAIGAFALILAMAGPFMFFKGIFGVLYGSTMKWAGSILSSRNKVGELQTAQSAFQQHAANTVIPTIAAEDRAIEKLGAAMAITATKARDLALAQRSVVGGMSAGTTAGKKHNYHYPKGTIVNGKDVSGGFMPKPHGPELPPGGVNALIPVNSTLGPLKDINTELEDTKKKTGVLRGQWTGIAQGMLLITPMIMAMTGATGGWSTALMGVLLTLGMFPQILIKIGKMIAGLSVSQALVGRIAAMKAGLIAYTAGAKGATLATRVLGTAIKSMMGPLGIIIAAITVLMVGWNKYKNEIKEAKAETNALNTAAKSLAGVIGYEYETAQAGATHATTKATQTLHDQAKAWIETGEKAKLAAKQIEEASSIEQAAALARRIGIDARAHGAEAEEAFRAAKAAMLAGGYNMSDVLEQLKISDFIDKDAALKIEMEETGKAFGEALTHGYKKGAKADQALEDFGPKIAAQLNGKTRDEIFDSLTTLMNDINIHAYDKFEEINFEQADFDIMGDYDIDLGSLEDVRRFFEEELPRIQANGDLQQLPAGMMDLQAATALAAEKEELLVEQMKKARGYTAAHYNDINTMAEYRKLDSGLTMNQADAEKHYQHVLSESKREHNRNNVALSMSGKNTYAWSEAQELALLNQHRLARGLPKTSDLTLGFGRAADEAASDVDGLATAMEEIDVNGFRSAMRSAIQSDMSDVVGMLMQSYDDDTEAYKDGVKDRNDAWNDAFDDRRDRSDQEFEDRQRREEAELNRQEKAMDTRHDDMLDAAEKQKSARVEAIEAEMDKADDLDDKRKAMFQAEMTRLQRLQAAANRNIDFNVALDTGNLDEAARIQEAAYTDDVSNAMSDAGAGMDDAAAARRKAGESRIASVTAAEDKKITGIQAVIEKEREAFEVTKQTTKDALDLAKKAAADRFDAEKDSYEKSARAAEKSYDRARAAKRKQVEESLKLVSAEVPQNIEQYQKMFGTLDAEYTKQTGKAAAKTTEWNDKHREGFHKAMQITYKELADEAAWKKVGGDSVDSMIQGMLGMTFAEFANWMETGHIPKKSTSVRPNVGGGTNPLKMSGEGSIGGRHSGGSVDGSLGSRAGRPWDAPLYPDEQKIIAQKGEFVVQKKAVDEVGLPTLNAINSGQTSFFHEGGLVGAAGAKIMTTFRQAANLAIMKGAQRKAEEMAAAGMHDDIPEALKFVAEAAKGGKYGSTQLDNEQLRNASAIIGIGRGMGASQRDLLVAIMAALEKSALRNVSRTDQNAVGLFRQGGWGSVEEMLNPKNSAREFFERLLQVKGRSEMGLAQAATAALNAGGDFSKWQDEAEAILSGAGSQGAGAVGGPQYQGGGTFSAFGGRVTGDIQGLQVEFLNRLARWSAAMGQGYHVGSGYRSMAEQQILYNRYMAGVPGQAPAAPPGRSNHNFGLASDGPRWGGRNPERFGLTYPMSYEPWHIEPIGAKGMRVPQMAVGGHVNYDNTIANLHKNETVLTAPLSAKLEQGLDRLDSGTVNHYTIKVDGTGLNADAIADRVMTKIERKEQARGPKRVIK